MRLVVVGAGPGATGLLERLVANVPELLGDRPVEVVLVDPHPPGAGRIWRPDQSPHLLMNSMAEDVTMFPDESVVCAGPIATGPSLAEWAATHEPAVTGRSFASRRVQSAYLSWTYDRIVASAPATVRIRAVAGQVVGVEDTDGSQLVRLAGVAEPLVADVVVLALGHLGARPTGPEAALDRFAAEHGLVYVPPAYTADLDLDVLRPGADVLVQGLGLAFVDLVAMVTEGRGGRFVRTGGRLEYEPSGLEPRLLAGSRRGVPYHSKTGYQLAGPRPPLPRFFTAAEIDALHGTGRPADFRHDVWPLIAKEIGWGYYHELFQAHPDRTRLPWPEFAAGYADLPWHSDGRLALVAAAVPDPVDRLDLERLDRPLTGQPLPADADEAQARIRDYVAADVERRADVRFSADLGAFLALLSVYGTLPRLLDGAGLTAASQVRELDGWWHGFFSFVASGPPGFRLEELLALSRAGLVRFLGPDTTVAPAAAGPPAFVATGPWLPAEGVAAGALVDARLPAPSVSATTEPLLASLVAAGQLVEEVLDGGLPTGRVQTVGPGHVVGADGRPHARRFAVGYFTSLRIGAAFARPHTNAIPFRRADATARAVLTALAVPSAPAVAPLEETDAVH